MATPTPLTSFVGRVAGLAGSPIAPAHGGVRQNVDMERGSFADYLAGLDESALIGLLRVRPDVRLEPVPRGFEQLAQRLSGPDSLAAALRLVDRDAVVVCQAVAAVGSAATVAVLARLFGASEATVLGAVESLCGHGLAWVDGATVCLPERLAMHWSAEIGGGRPVATIARSVLADDLRSTVEALGIDASGLRKPESIARLGEVLADLRATADLVRGLPKPARDRLDQLRHGYGTYYPGYDSHRDPRGATADRTLAAAGLVLRANGRWEMPREVAVATWLAERELALTGPPEIPRVSATTQATAQAAAQDILRSVTALLDEAGSSSIVALKKGGVGPRERSRLATRLSVPADVLLLGVDLAYAAGLLGLADAGYAPTEAYPAWRAAEPAWQWSKLVIAWFGLEHAPTSRGVQGDKELPPPLPLASAAGAIRRAVLRAGADGRSVRAAGEHIDWFFPLHGYDETRLRDKVMAAVREAELLGVVASDVVTDCGERLLAVVDDDPDGDSGGNSENDSGGDPDRADVVGRLAGRVAGLLPELPCTVIPQSDLTAVVSGQPTTAVSRVLGASAVSEARGSAGVWRFTPASVRAALDAGWTAERLLAELAAVSDRALPQPLEYLITDVARRHGQIRVRGMRSCVLADEAMITELLHTRSLAKLGLARLAPTVLSSPYELDEVLARLRAAGLSPVAEDGGGAVIVETRPEHRASAPSPRMAVRARLRASELADRLLADPDGETGGGAAGSATFDQLAQLNPDLDVAELMLLADAVDHHHDVLITYRDKHGGQTVRAIQPRQIYGRWLDSWCHLRDGEREFTVANIESVAPVG
ncbi:MAG TPA: helicase-associated domain-containing protein [Pseudonocardiaceae bacterium]|nr:helicase-associated domain-containing protein [Pseudonocardiaceae bacterium]